ncbi:MAG: hypothetical protein AAB581_03325 [Patescibacteria group bacterium]
MSCEEMEPEWQEIEQEVEKVVEALPELPPKEVIMEEIHMETHKLVDLQKVIFGKPNLKRAETAALMKSAARNILANIKAGAAKHLPVHVTGNSRQRAG